MHAAITEVGILYATAHGARRLGRRSGKATAMIAYQREQPAATPSRSSPTTATGSGSRTPGGPTGARAGSAGSPTTTGWRTAPTSGSRGSARRSTLRRAAGGQRHRMRVGRAAQLRSSSTRRCGRTSSASATTGGSPRPAPTALTPERRRRDHSRSSCPRQSRPGRPSACCSTRHGGLVCEDSALQSVANYRRDAARAQVYPLAFIWRTDYWTTITNILQDAVGKRRPEGILDAAKDFMLDRLDDALEPVARLLGGKALWDEMKENATLASTGRGRRRDRGAADPPSWWRSRRKGRRRSTSSATAPAASSSRRSRSSSPAEEGWPGRQSNLHALGARLHHASCSRRATLPRSSETGESRASTCSPWTRRPSGTTTAPTSTTSRCSTWYRTRSRRSGGSP